MLQTASSAIVQTAVVGGSEGSNFNAIELAQWPRDEKNLNVNSPISKIEVRHDQVVEALNVTYRYNGGTTRQHGAQWIGQSDSFDLSADEVLADVYGLTGHSSQYGRTVVTQISFVVLNTKTAQAQIKGPYGSSSNTGTPFHASGVIGFAGLEMTGAPGGLVALSFLSSQAWR